MVLNEVSRYQDYFGEEPLELLVVLLGLGGGLWMAIRGSYPARLIWLGLLFAAAFFVVAVSTKSKYYMLLTYPLYVLMLARVLERTAVWVTSLWSARVVGASPISSSILAVLVAVVMVWPLKLDERAWGNYIQARRYREGRVFQLTSRLKELAGPARDSGPARLLIGLHDHPYWTSTSRRVERQYGMTPAQYLTIRPTS